MRKPRQRGTMKQSARRRLKLVDCYLSGRTTISFLTRTTPSGAAGDFDCSVSLLPVPGRATQPHDAILIGVHLQAPRLAGWSAASLVLMAAVMAESFTNCAGCDLSVSESCARPMTGANRDAASTQAIMRFVFHRGLLRQFVLRTPKIVGTPPWRAAVSASP